MKPFIPTTLATLLLSIPLISTPAKAQDAFSACLNSARTYNLSNDEIVIACQEATASIASCLETGWRLNLRGVELASVCRKARVNTSPCINTAWKNGLRGNQIGCLSQEVTPLTRLQNRA